jgi:hypothetical protein
LLLVIAKLTQDFGNIAQARQALGSTSNSADISFASKLWQVFSIVISGVLDDLKAVLGDAVASMMVFARPSALRQDAKA